MDLKQKKADRFSFLHKAYEAVEGKTTYVIDGWLLGNELGFDRDYSTSIYHYLNDEGLIEPRGAGIRFAITHNGVKEIEEVLSSPDRPTEHFLPYSQYTLISV
jgi:hypothetical protein